MMKKRRRQKRRVAAGTRVNARVQSVEACCVACGRRQQAEAGCIAEGEGAQHVEPVEDLHATTHHVRVLRLDGYGAFAYAVCVVVRRGAPVDDDEAVA
jgi:hypothetical protein